MDHEPIPSADELQAAHPEINSPSASPEELVRRILHDGAIVAANRLIAMIHSDNHAVALKAAMYLVERAAPVSSGGDADEWRRFFADSPASRAS